MANKNKNIQEIDRVLKLFRIELGILMTSATKGEIYFLLNGKASSLLLQLVKFILDILITKKCDM